MCANDPSRFAVLHTAYGQIGDLDVGVKPLRTSAYSGGVEEGRDHRGKPVGAVDDGEVCGTWQDGELGGRKPGAVAIDAAANQPEDLHRVLRLHDVGIANDDQCWSGDRLDVSGPPALELAVELVAFADQSGPVPRIWGHSQIPLMEDRVREVIRDSFYKLRSGIGVEAVVAVSQGS